MVGLMLAGVALAAGPTPEALLERAAGLRGEGALADAISIQQDVVVRDPELALGWLELGVTHAWAGELEAAERALAHGLRVDPHDRAARAMYARVVGWQGRHREAAARWAALRADDPTDPEAAVGAGDLALARGRPGAAREAYGAALAVAPEHAAAQAGLARAEAHRRGSLELGGDTWQFGGGSAGLGGRLALAVDATARLSLRASGTTGRAVGPDLAPAEGVLHQGEAGVRVATRPGIGLGVSAHASAGARVWRGVGLSVDAPLGPLVVGGTWRPGVEAGGATDDLLRVGVATTGRTWVQLQGFAYSREPEGRARSAALTVGTELRAHALRLDLSLTRADIGDMAGAALGWRSAWWGRHGLGLSLEGLTGAVDRVGATATWRMAL